jgi:predicted Fe-Mo cluster-binding NifX family protein
VVLVQRTDQTVQKTEFLKNPHSTTDTAKGIRVAEWLVKAGIDHVGMKEDVSRKGPGYVLANGGIQAHLITSDHLDAAIDEILAEGI